MAGAEERGLLKLPGATASLPESVRDQLVDRRQRVVVLGATGWLGMVALDLLDSALGSQFPTQVSAWASRERSVTLRSGTKVAVRSLADARPDDVGGALVLHFAFLTRDRVAGMGTDAYMAANLAITHRVLALIEAGRPSALVYASSGAAYDERPDNPYGTAKRLDEVAFGTACRETAAACVIPRVFSISGPYMTKPQLYALGDLLQQAERGDRLRIRATKPVYRSYIAARDLLSVCVAAALAGERDLVFDSGGDVAEVGELAEVVRDVCGRPELTIERDWDPTAESDRYVANRADMDELCRLHGVVQQSLRDQVVATAAGL